MIIKKVKQVDKNCVRCFRTVKACNETKLQSQLLHTIMSTFKMAVQILDTVQVLPTIQNVCKMIFTVLLSLYEVWNITNNEESINRSRNIHKSPRGSCKKKRICSENQFSPNIMNKLPNSDISVFLSAYTKLTLKNPN